MSDVRDTLACCVRKAALCLQDLSLLLCLSWGGHVTRLGQWDMSGSGLSLAFPPVIGQRPRQSCYFLLRCLGANYLSVSPEHLYFRVSLSSSFQCTLFNAFHYYFTQISAISTQCTDLWSNNCGGVITSSEFYDLPF